MIELHLMVCLYKNRTYLKAYQLLKIKSFMPFPYSTIDFQTKKHSNIPIEERDGKEPSHLAFKKEGDINRRNLS